MAGFFSKKQYAAIKMFHSVLSNFCVNEKPLSLIGDAHPYLEFSSTPTLSDSLLHYENDYLSFDYPSNMKVEEISHTLDWLPLKESFELMLYSKELPIWFRFVKSTMFDVFNTPEEWRDASIRLNQITKLYLSWYL